MKILSMQVLPGNTYSVYSYTAPDCTASLAYCGGWATAADVGPDVLYSTPVGQVTASPLQFTNAPPYPAHENDPTVVAPTSDLGTADRAGWLYMFYTSLPNTAVTLEQIETQNQIGLASATNPKGPWTYEGIIIQNGWSPSALNDGASIWLWYNTGGQNFATCRAKVEENGVIVDVITMCLNENGLPLRMGNVSVTMAGGLYYMVGNYYGDLTKIAAYQSTDGINWVSVTGEPSNIIVDGGTTQVITPELKPIPGQPMQFTLTFTQPVGFNPNGTYSSVYTMQWTIQL